MDAMDASRTKSTAGQLWQMPLLLVSLGAFGYATYRFADQGPGATTNDQIELARAYLKYDRPESATTEINKILISDRPTVEQEGEVRRLLAASLERGQTLRGISLPSNHNSIIEQTKLARDVKADLTGADYRRLGRSFEAVGKVDDALTAYARAMELDPGLEPELTRRTAEALLKEVRHDVADAVLARYLKIASLSAEERAWALGERAELLITAKKFAEARELLGQILGLAVDDTVRGHTAYRYGLCAYELGDKAEAERQLRMARQLLRVRHPADAEAAYLLGRIYEQRNQPDEAMSFYRDVLISHPDSRAMLPSRLGRGVARVMRGDDDAGMEDLTWVSQQLGSKPALKRRHTAAALESFEKAELILASRQNYQGALELLGLEKSLVETPAASFWGRVANVYERRAEQVEAASEKVDAEEERRQLRAAARQLRVKAGDASFSYSMALTLSDNDGYGEALRRAIDLYDQAGAVQSVIAALELFALERPSDPLTPDAILRLGKAHMAAGEFDKAIVAFERNRFRYSGFVAATKSAVPLAQALIAKGAAFYGKAEKVLISVVEDNLALTPQAEEFRNAVFELGSLYYRQARHEESIARFDEVMKRYPTEERMGQVLFLMADAYRKSALALAKPAAATVAAGGAAVGSARPLFGGGIAAGGGRAEELTEAETARRQRLAKALDLFDRVISHHRDRPLSKDIERAQLRLSHFYRADCAFDLGDYDRAIKHYDHAAFRYQDDASALAAYVQIVNANVALGRQAEARSANERAKWLLRRMPASAFSDGSFALSKAYWEQWLKWSGEAGMWPEGTGLGVGAGDGGGGGAVAGANSAGGTTENAPVAPR